MALSAVVTLVFLAPLLLLVLLGLMYVDRGRGGKASSAVCLRYTPPTSGQLRTDVNSSPWTEFPSTLSRNDCTEYKLRVSGELRVLISTLNAEQDQRRLFEALLKTQRLHKTRALISTDRLRN